MGLGLCSLAGLAKRTDCVDDIGKGGSKYRAQHDADRACTEEPSMIPTTVIILTIVVASTGPPASLLISISEP